MKKATPIKATLYLGQGYRFRGLFHFHHSRNADSLDAVEEAESSEPLSSGSLEETVFQGPYRGVSSALVGTPKPTPQ